ncbi:MULTISPECIES: hypothetical protein [Capnocytophaga]|nr:MULTISPECIES: hypothetical protein [Capnocytophaga]
MSKIKTRNLLTSGSNILLYYCSNKTEQHEALPLKMANKLRYFE